MVGQLLRGVTYEDAQTRGVATGERGDKYAKVGAKVR